MIGRPQDSNLSDLPNLSGAELEKIWRQKLSERVPDHLPKSLLARLLAYRLQVNQHGGLSKRADRYLKVIETDLLEGRLPKSPYLNDQKLKPGCQLIREHNGMDHRITVVDGGYEWDSKIFASLSAVAKAITGTNWSGQRFFGLKSKSDSSAVTAL